MGRELARQGVSAIAKKVGGGALKKAAKKAPGKKSAKKAPGKKVPGKKAPGKKGAPEHVSGGGPEQERAFHHLQRASAVISLLEGESGGDLRMLLEEGVAAYRAASPGAHGRALGLLRAAEHLAMAGLYAARASHRLDVLAPAGDRLERKLDEVGLRLDDLRTGEATGFAAQLPGVAAELLARAEAAGQEDLHLGWELVMAADGICAGLEAEG